MRRRQRLDQETEMQRNNVMGETKEVEKEKEHGKSNAQRGGSKLE